jgi:putative Ca2+/H+ antiporter (TMEM165/GDT1 family)
MLIIGSIIGSIWMMMYGVILPAELANTIHLHKLLQFEGFITLIIMGIGYLIVPRFRNVSVPL